MTFFTLLIVIKITITLLLIAIPFLFLPLSRLTEITSCEIKEPLYFRLYGVAILSLLVGYASSISDSQNGVFPWAIAMMGLVSNGGATALLLNNKAAQSPVLIMFLSLITVCLLLAMAFPQVAVNHIW